MELEYLPKEFVHKIAPGNIIRANLRTEKDALQWINLFSKHTSTNWLLYKAKTAPKFLLDKKWICGHNRKNKIKNRSTRSSSADCGATINIKIKRLNKASKNSDQYLTNNPPLTAIISLNLQHKHDSSTPNDSVNSKAHQRHEEMKELFYEYFSKGMDIVQALNYHIKLSLSDNHCGDDEVDVGDVTFQPKEIMYTWYKEWKKTKTDSDDNNANLNLKLDKVMDTENIDKAELIAVKTEVENFEDFGFVKNTAVQELQRILEFLPDNYDNLNILHNINLKLNKITTKKQSVEFFTVLENVLSSVK